MTTDTLHYAIMLTGWVAVPALLLASLILYSRVRSRWSLALLMGLVLILSGRIVQLFSPINDLAYEEFRGIVVSYGELPLAWYAGDLISSAGLLVAAMGALGMAFTTERWS